MLRELYIHILCKEKTFDRPYGVKKNPIFILFTPRNTYTAHVVKKKTYENKWLQD